MNAGVFTYWRLHRIPILLALLSLVFYWVFAYDLTRTASIKLLCLVAALFVLCYKLIQFEKWNYRLLLGFGLGFRLVFLLSTPVLSPDFYRFIWDGNLIVNGLNPYQFLPSELISSGSMPFANASEVYAGLSGLSQENFSNYAPVNQWFFALGSYLGGGQILPTLVSLRLLIILGDLGVFYFGRKLLKLTNRSPHMIFWYFLNPLVIIELSGNLHFEGIMACFLIVALYLLASGRFILAGIPFALSVGIKLLPLMLLPLLLPAAGLKKTVIFYWTTGLTLALCVLSFYAPGLEANYLETLKLWFSNFEFNASLYQLAEHLGSIWEVKPWEFVKIYGKQYPVLVIAVVVLLSLGRPKNPMNYFLIAATLSLSLFLFLSPTVHPWYLIVPLLLSLYTDFKYLILWSGLVFLSYITYALPDFQEDIRVQAIEYLLVFSLLAYEMFKLFTRMLQKVKNQSKQDPK